MVQQWGPSHATDSFCDSVHAKPCSHDALVGCKGLVQLVKVPEVSLQPDWCSKLAGRCVLLDDTTQHSTQGARTFTDSP